MTTVNYTIAATADDVTNFPGGPGFFNTLVIAGLYSGFAAHVGFRFVGVAVPQGATINSATLSPNNAGTDFATSAGAIKGVAADNAPAWTTTAPDAATKTTASVAVAGALGIQNYDVAAIVQEIVSRAGWSSGNALAFAGDPTGADSYVQWDDKGDAATTATLSIDYTPGASSTYTLTAASATYAVSATAATLTKSGWQTPLIGSVVTATSGNLALTEPAGVASGMLLVASITNRGTASFTLPAGWSLVSTQQASGNTTVNGTGSISGGLMAYIVRGGSAPALSFTRTAGDLGYGQILAYQFVGSGAITYDTGSAATLAAAGTTVTTGTITAAAARELIVAALLGARSGTASAFDAATDPTTQSGTQNTTQPPTIGTWLERTDNGTTSGADGALSVADAIRASAGATGTIQAVSSTSARHAMVAGAWKVISSGSPYTLTAASASYTDTATAAGLQAGRRVSAASATYSLTATAAGLKVGRKVGALSASYTASGAPAALRTARTLAAAGAAYTVTATAAGLRRGSTLSAASATFTLSAQAAGLVARRSLVSGSATYSVSATAAGLKATRALSATSASYSVSATAAGLKRGLVLGAASATYSYTPTAATLTYTPSVAMDYVLTADGASCSVTATAATLRVGRALGAGPGACTLAVSSVSFRAARRLAADTVGYVWTATDATLQEPPNPTAEPAVYAWSAGAATLRRAARLSAEPAVFTLTGGTVRLHKGRRLTISAPAARTVLTMASTSRDSLDVTAPAARAALTVSAASRPTLTVGETPARPRLSVAG